MLSNARVARDPQRSKLLEEMAAGQRYGETWRQWSDRLMSLVVALRELEQKP